MPWTQLTPFLLHGSTFLWFVSTRYTFDTIQWHQWPQKPWWETFRWMIARLLKGLYPCQPSTGLALYDTKPMRKYPKNEPNQPKPNTIYKGKSSTLHKLTIHFYWFFSFNQPSIHSFNFNSFRSSSWLPFGLPSSYLLRFWVWIPDLSKSPSILWLRLETILHLQVRQIPSKALPKTSAKQASLRVPSFGDPTVFGKEDHPIGLGYVG